MAGKRQRFPNTKSSKSLQFLEAFANQSPTYCHANLHLLFLRDSIPVCQKPTKKGTKMGIPPLKLKFRFDITYQHIHPELYTFHFPNNHHFDLHQKKRSEKSPWSVALRCVGKRCHRDPRDSESATHSAKGSTKPRCGWEDWEDPVMIQWWFFEVYGIPFCCLYIWKTSMKCRNMYIHIMLTND